LTVSRLERAGAKILKIEETKEVVGSLSGLSDHVLTDSFDFTI